MGILDQIDALDIPADKKAELRAEAIKDMTPMLASDAEVYVEKLRKVGFSEENGCTGFLKGVRRILMSADAHEPGAVLMSDSDLGLTGDKATGATQRDEVSLAGQLKALFDSLPTDSSDGQKAIKIALSDQALEAEAGDPPPKGDEAANDPQKAREGLNKVTGNSVTGVSRKRYRRGGVPVATGGDS